MDQKVKELTEKLYHEGVEKGGQKAQEIIRAAEERSAAILDEAKVQAEKIFAEAEKKAGELKRNMEADIRLSAGQAMSALKQQIVDALMLTVVDRPVSAALADPATIKEFLKILIQSWNAPGGEPVALEILLPENKKEEILSALKAGLQDELRRGLTLRFLKNIKAGFQIQPQGSAFKISLTDDDFREFFKEYLRPKTRAFLFGE